MKTKTGMSIGLALTLMVGVFATMLALGLFTNNEVQAQSAASATRSFNPATVDPGEPVIVTIAFTGAILGINETIPAGFTYVTSTVDSGQVTVNGQNIALNLFGEASPITYTVTAPTTEDSYDFSGTLRGQDADEPVGGDTTVTVAAGAQASNSVSAVAVAHTPGGTSENARVTVDFYSPTALTANLDTITIEFEDDVQVPGLLDERFISVVGTSGSNVTVASPLDVTVERVGIPADEPRVTLTLGDHNPAEELVSGIEAGMVSVIFRQAAGIKNPTEAGTWNVKVTTNKSDGYVPSSDDNSFKTYRTLSLNNKSGKRGSTLTATGAGFKNSTTATVFLDSNGDKKKQGAEVVLCDAAIGSTDTFTCDFVVNVPPFINGTNTINAIDGREGAAKDSAPWDLSPQVKATPRTAAIGDTVTVDLLDFEENMTAAKFDVGGVEIMKGGSEQLPQSGPTGSSTHTITIPNGVALGKQALRVQFPGGSSYRVTMTITGAQLSVAPASVVPNQSVTITGHGFTGSSVLYGVTQVVDGVVVHHNDAVASKRNTDEATGGLSGIFIGGTQVAWDKIDDGELVEVDSGGNWVATVVIPVTSPSTIPGVYELKAFDSAGRPGVTTLTVKPRTIDFEPKESRVGTTLTVTGTGWVASNSAPGAESANISVDYYLPGASDSDASGRANPDSDGNFTTTIRVPLNASIPSTNRVEVQFEDQNDRAVTETAAHRVPGATITITPSSGPGGTIATLTGGGFKAFTTMTLLEVGGTLVQPRPVGPSVSRDGTLQDTLVLVPGLDAGTHTVKVQVGDATVSTPFTITDDAALAPVGTTADTTPADAFAALIDSGNLIGVFRYDDETQAYQTYDPDPANAGFNNLETVSSGDIFWVRLREDQTFLGKLRRAEWAQVVLP